MTYWPKRMLELAHHVASWSKDPNTKAGAVVCIGNRVLGLGYNGFPRGVEDTDARYIYRQTKYRFVVHAEVNAILDAGRDAEGAALFNTLFPCTECTKILIQAGIRELVVDRAGQARMDSNLVGGGAEEVSAVTTMLYEAGVAFRWEDR
jgi:dCMP deaminase